MWRSRIVVRSFVKCHFHLRQKLIGYLSFLLKEPPKEDLTVSEKFQLVLDVAQKAQVLCYSHLFGFFPKTKRFVLKWSEHLPSLLQMVWKQVLKQYFSHILYLQAIELPIGCLELLKWPNALENWLAFSKSWFRTKSKGEEKSFLTLFFRTVCSQVSENVDQAVNLRKVLEHRSIPQMC